MHLDLTDEQKLLERTVREFANSEVKPLAKKLDETGQFPRETFRKAAELGLTGITLPEQYGGAGLDHQLCHRDRRNFAGMRFDRNRQTFGRQPPKRSWQRSIRTAPIEARMK